MKTFGGKTVFLDRPDINTDEIIPAKYLTEISKEALGPHLLEDLVLDGFDPGRDLDGAGVLVTRENFGCGSSREHAPWALEVRGINLVIAESFARIFRQNMYNCGMMAVELPPEVIDELVHRFGGASAGGPESGGGAAGVPPAGGEAVRCDVDLTELKFLFTAGRESMTVPYQLGGFDRALIEAGGWVEFADARY
jgi:3-isopropylmalate/(R)-2-methylmalate dehydratase small subunit